MFGKIVDVSNMVSSKTGKPYSLLRVQDEDSGVIGTCFGPKDVQLEIGQRVILDVSLDYRYNWTIAVRLND